jgi:hypothetical protein
MHPRAQFSALLGADMEMPVRGDAPHSICALDFVCGIRDAARVVDLER